MSDSTDDAVVAAVVESLKSITPLAGYPAEGYHTLLPLAMTSADPLVKPLPGAAPLVRVMYEPSSGVVTVDFWVVGSGRADSVRQALNLAADIRRRLLEEDPTLGGRVLSVDEVAVDEPDADPISRNDGSARMSFAVRALAAEANEKEQA